jgi:hypothetical protein
VTTRPDGKLERAAIYAHISARLHGIPSRDHKEWFEEEAQLELSQQQVERAVSPVRWSSPKKGARGRPGKKRTKLPWIVRDWFDVRADRLGLIQVLIVIEGKGESLAALAARLAGLPGITKVTETATQRNLVADALFTDGLEEAWLRAQVEELTDLVVHWEHVRTTTQSPALLTWVHLARGQGVTEGVALPR